MKLINALSTGLRIPTRARIDLLILGALAAMDLALHFLTPFGPMGSSFPWWAEVGHFTVVFLTSWDLGACLMQATIARRALTNEPANH